MLGSVGKRGDCTVASVSPEQPLVTVAIPTFNRSGLLRLAVESVLAQTYSALEVYVADNGSEDDTPDVVAAIGERDPRIHYARLDTNIGMLGNLERSLRLGTGPYLMMLHDDDLMRPRNVAEKVRLLEERPDAVIAHSAMSYIDGDGNVTDERVAWGVPIDPVEDSSTFITRMFSTCNRVSPSGTLVRRSAIEHEHYEAEDKAANDMGLWLRVARRGAVVYTDEPLVAIRQHAMSQTASTGVRALSGGGYDVSFKSVGEIRLVLDRFAARFSGDPVPGPTLKRLARKSTSANLAMAIRQELGDRPRRSDLMRRVAEAVRIEPTFLLSADGAELMAAAVGGEPGAKLVQRAVPWLKSARSFFVR